MSKTGEFTISKFQGAIGRRKTAVAQIRLSAKKTGIIVNGKNYQEYFPISKHQEKVSAPLRSLGVEDKFGAEVKVAGGGLTGQAEAIRLGLSRALVKVDNAFRKKLRLLGYLTRDPRMVERKKYGLKKARRAPQWAKR